MNNDKPPDRSIGWDDVEIAIVGSGVMGSLLAQAYAQNGVNVGLIGRREESLKRAQYIIQKELQAAIEGNIFSPLQVEEIRERILFTSSYEPACRGKNLKLVLETATEDILVKKEIFKKLDELCPATIVFGTNTSCLDANLLARETRRPDRVVWMHYFFPPHKNHGGEYAPLESTSRETLETAAQLMKRARKTPTPLLKYRKGGASNTIFVALLLEAGRMVDEGHDIPSIEAAGKTAFNMPFGFLGLADTVGLSLSISCLRSFSDGSVPADPFYKVYNNFFSPPEIFDTMQQQYASAPKKSAVRWVREEDAQKPPGNPQLVDILIKRFRAVAFMTAVEVVDSGLIEIKETDKLCQHAFFWHAGPFAMMNKMGIQEALRLVTERMELSHRKEINFPIPMLFIEQARQGAPWPL
jgi:3-hydroxyacyl-CoA dehydrogenase